MLVASTYWFMYVTFLKFYENWKFWQFTRQNFKKKTTDYVTHTVDEDHHGFAVGELDRWASRAFIWRKASLICHPFRQTFQDQTLFLNRGQFTHEFTTHSRVPWPGLARLTERYTTHIHKFQMFQSRQSRVQIRTPPTPEESMRRTPSKPSKGSKGTRGFCPTLRTNSH